MVAGINSLLKDLDIHDENKYVCTYGIRSYIKKIDEELMEEHSKLKKLTNLYVDGKKGPALIGNCKTKFSDLHSVITEPKGCYVTHFETKNGKGITIANEIYKVIKRHDSEASISAIGFDGAPTNTGKKNLT